MSTMTADEHREAFEEALRAADRINVDDWMAAQDAHPRTTVESAFASFTVLDPSIAVKKQDEAAWSRGMTVLRKLGFVRFFILLGDDYAYENVNLPAMPSAVAA